MKRVSCLLTGILLAFSVSLQAQEVRGHWYGIGKLQASQAYQDYLSELTIRQNGRNVTGSFQYYFKDSLVTAPISGSYNPQTRKLSLKPFKMIYYLSPTAQNSIDCEMSGDFSLLVSKTESVLTGRLFPDANHRYTVPNISFRLTKSDDTATLVMNNDVPEPEDTMAVAPAAIIAENPAPQPIATPEPGSSEAAFASRAKVYTKELAVAATRLRIEIYDNGQVDYDSVSLFLNGKMVLKKSKLDHKAIRFWIDLDTSLPFNELSMVAENLGMIPPNTAAIAIYDGTTCHETLMTSDLSKTATIKLVRRE